VPDDIGQVGMVVSATAAGRALVDVFAGKLELGTMPIPLVGGEDVENGVVAETLELLVVEFAMFVRLTSNAPHTESVSGCS
jgi:hypothetical protein